MENRQILESWKEISAHLKRNIRTCRRWESELGLPIHRLDGTPKARVYAYADELDGWLEEKLKPKEAKVTDQIPETGNGLKRLLILALGILTVAVVIFLILRYSPGRRISGAPSAPPTLAVLNFENKSGDKTLDFWRSALPELLVADLSQSRFIRVVAVDHMLTVLRRLGLADALEYSSEDIGKIAAQTRATYVLRGSFVKAGDSIVITADLQKSGLAVGPAAFRLKADKESDIIPKVDDLTRRIKEGLDLTASQIAADIEMDVGQITTASPEALKYYIEGEKRLNRNESRQATACFERAVEIDPEFAMAYRELASIYEGSRKMAEAWNFLNKALELSGRLPETERLLIEAQRSDWLHDYPKAIEILERLLKIYPGNIMAHESLAQAYASIGDEKRYLEHLEFVVRNKRTAAVVLYLSWHYMRSGLYQKAEEACRSFLQEVEDNAGIREELALVYLCRRQFDRALVEAEKAYLLDPYFNSNEALGKVLVCSGDLARGEKVCEQNGPWYLWHIALLHGQFGKAVALARRDLEMGRYDMNIRPNVYEAVSYVLEKAGRYREALEANAQAEKEAAADQPPWLFSRVSLGKTALILRGKIQAETKSFDEAGRTAAELKTLIEKGPDLSDLRWHEYLLGYIALEKRDFKGAVGRLTKACSSLFYENGEYHDPHALFYEALARAYYESGDLEKARGQYEKVTLLTSGRLNHPDIYAKAFYMLGKIAQQQGDRPRARENYRKFLDLWEDADPGVLEVADATQRLASLKT